MSCNHTSNGRFEPTSPVEPRTSRFDSWPRECLSWSAPPEPGARFAVYAKTKKGLSSAPSVVPVRRVLPCPLLAPAALAPSRARVLGRCACRVARRSPCSGRGHGLAVLGCRAGPRSPRPRLLCVPGPSVVARVVDVSAGPGSQRYARLLSLGAGLRGRQNSANRDMRRGSRPFFVFASA